MVLQMPPDNWREQAEALFFIEHMRVGDIARVVRAARETVSRHICGCEGYDIEMAFRRELAAIKRREYKRRWDREKRPADYSADPDEASIRREHDIAAVILSREKYH